MKVCDHSCLTCSAGTASTCKTCPGSVSRTANLNSCPCNAGYYDDGTNALCLGKITIILKLAIILALLVSPLRQNVRPAPQQILD